MKRVKFSFGFPILRVLFIVTLVGIIFNSCTPESSEKTTAAIAPCLFPVKTYQLELDSNQYRQLKDAHPGSSASKLILQFYFTNANPSSFTLLAFSSKAQDQVEVSAGTTFTKVLKITTDNPVNIPDEVVFGDQQVLFSNIDRDIIGGRTDFILIFRPIVVGNRIKYKICLKGTACPAAEVITQPSPPANAN
ncbi:MAG TPA: hypothetical protein VIU35_15925 [Chitinophagaceae bacterium]